MSLRHGRSPPRHGRPVYDDHERDPAGVREAAASVGHQSAIAGEAAAGGMHAHMSLGEPFGDGII